MSGGWGGRLEDGSVVPERGHDSLPITVGVIWDAQPRVGGQWWSEDRKYLSLLSGLGRVDHTALSHSHSSFIL